MNIETQTQVLSSRPINISVAVDVSSIVLYALCEDGSIWVKEDVDAVWLIVQPPTASASLPENLRRVKWSIREWQGAEYAETQGGEGWFHGWARDHTATVEDDCGHVHQCAPNRVRFLDRDPMIGDQGD